MTGFLTPATDVRQKRLPAKLKSIGEISIAPAAGRDFGNMQKQELDIGHVNGALVDIDSGDMKVLPVVEPRIHYGLCQCDDHRTASNGRFLRDQEATFFHGCSDEQNPLAERILEAADLLFGASFTCLLLLAMPHDHFSHENTDLCKFGCADVHGGIGDEGVDDRVDHRCHVNEHYCHVRAPVVADKRTLKQSNPSLPTTNWPATSHWLGELHLRWKLKPHY